ncbi:Gfo/Idh/MocA family protein [Pseudonocardia humida]|uniref:Gfo/Idh/MocA family oxidoreductase n=1 Tax=Pseudonocardia humida TaxID=2800819 RepID=A0ABT1AC34_9PSEU|nr:Gfo/Idh/MocA family oxidoreductase [Pseudonocardia humida]MCO1660617.1 Gfo/Idh/MocA family oxidoreductase [Pseudonocardia humida]
MSDRVGVGVVGAGVISTQYLRTLTRSPDLDVRFVADLDVERARARATEFDVPRGGSVEELLADDDVRIVVNLTVPTAHVDVAMSALAAGRHVWNEKPLALDRAGGHALLDAARSAGLRVAAAPDTVLGPGFQRALRLVRSGAIGTPVSALAQLQNPGPESWHPDPAFLYGDGAGPLFDLGPYYLTALVHLLGPVARVQAVATRAREERVIGSGPRAGQRFPVTVATQVSALYTFTGGTTAQALFSFDSPLRRRHLEISGTGASVVVGDPNVFDAIPEVHHADGSVLRTPPIRTRVGRGVGVVELARAIRAGEPERASGELAHHVLDVMITTIEAAAAGGSVDVASTATAPPPLPDGWDPFT